MIILPPATIAIIAADLSPVPAMRTALAFHVPVRISRPAMAGSYALSYYSTDHMGGHVLAQRRAGRWVVIGIGGGIWTSVSIQRYGVPKAAADALLREMHAKS